ncbi:cupin domain-containing protein [Ruminococcus sp.]|uniref:cupin domain-containing protein n=1 Tax=Ruminococcus sp. TaxID=41978 RepID=UPI002611892F|nr:cupin domain-containing protein [Ruminococcus sp.]MDD6988981.1 cupin domain-containing protein [Ruminococcus sp.]MDY6201728.1 cupin domain-containing protein [Ruminococcus sp.]
MHNNHQWNKPHNLNCSCAKSMTDFGSEPFVVNIEQAACHNTNFRTALWTGENLQLTLMSIPKDGEIGVEMHNDTDQFLRIESGKGIVKMGSCRDRMNFHKYIGAGNAVFVPAGTWHNIINTGDCPIKLYSIYAPPKHPHSTVHMTKEIAEAEGD